MPLKISLIHFMNHFMNLLKLTWTPFQISWIPFIAYIDAPLYFHGETYISHGAPIDVMDPLIVFMDPHIDIIDSLRDFHC